MTSPSPEQLLAFPNVESLVVAFLGGRAELAGIRIVLRVPADYDFASPIVVVYRVGGDFSPDDFIDRALVRVDTYGPDKAAVLDLTGRVRSLVWLMANHPLPDGVVVTDVSEERGPSWLRDPASARANRYTTRFRLSVRVRSRPA